MAHLSHKSYKHVVQLAYPTDLPLHINLTFMVETSCGIPTQYWVPWCQPRKGETPETWEKDSEETESIYFSCALKDMEMTSFISEKVFCNRICSKKYIP